MLKIDTEDNFDKLFIKIEINKTIVAIKYDDINDSLNYILLTIDREKNILQQYEGYNMESYPFIYNDVKYRLLKSTLNKSFILTRYTLDNKVNYSTIYKNDMKIAKDLVSFKSNL